MSDYSVDLNSNTANYNVELNSSTLNYSIDLNSNAINYSIELNSNSDSYTVIINPLGGAAAVTAFEDTFILSANQTIFTLSTAPLTVTRFYVNGLKQLQTSFTIVGNMATVTDFTPTSGDTVVFSYFY